MMYASMYYALKEGRAKRCLVVAPSAIIPDWLDDAKAFPQLRVQAYYKNEKTKRSALTTPAHVILWSAGTFANDLELIKKIGFGIVVFDESSKLKNHRSQMAKAALELSKSVDGWYNLSATPAPNGEYEYYVQMLCVDPYCFDPARTHFVNKWFMNMSNDKNYEKLTINPLLRNQFMEIVKSHSIFVDQSVIPTAGKRWDIVQYDMDPATRQAYINMAKESALEFDGVATITADQAAATRAKLAQITSGFIMDTDAIKANEINRKVGDPHREREIYPVGPGERLDTLRRVLDTISREGADTSVIVWATYAQEFRDIERLLGSKCRTIRGGTGTAEKEDIVKAFRNKEFPVLLAHPLSLGMGVNLTVAHWAVYYSLNDSWEALKQSSERIVGHIRIQPHRCRYVVIAARDSIDEKIYDNVMHKRDSSLDILNHIRAVVLQ